MNTKDIKDFYLGYHDQIRSKRYNSPYWIRRYAHRQTYNSLIKHVDNGKTVLDAGCGEGVLSLLMAQKGAIVTGIDISYSNILSAQNFAKTSELTGSVKFLLGDAENLPVADNSFDIVVSSHVLEHLPSFQKGLKELYRVTRHKAIIALPTCLNPCAWALLGRDNYWALSKRSVFGIPFGIAKTFIALCKGIDGPNENYGGQDGIPHAWRFPGVMMRQIREIGFKIVLFEASTILIPYLAQYIPGFRSIQTILDRFCDRPPFNLYGYGSVAVCYKTECRC